MPALVHRSRLSRSPPAQQLSHPRSILTCNVSPGGSVSSSPAHGAHFPRLPACLPPRPARPVPFGHNPSTCGAPPGPDMGLEGFGPAADPTINRQPRCLAACRGQQRVSPPPAPRASSLLSSACAPPVTTKSPSWRPRLTRLSLVLLPSFLPFPFPLLSAKPQRLGPSLPEDPAFATFLSLQVCALLQPSSSCLCRPFARGPPAQRLAAGEGSGGVGSQRACLVPLPGHAH